MSGLQRITVNLTERSSAALQLAVGLTEDSKTDVVNRAVQVYAYLLHKSQVAGPNRTVRIAGADEAEAVTLLL